MGFTFLDGLYPDDQAPAIARKMANAAATPLPDGEGDRRGVLLVRITGGRFTIRTVRVALAVVRRVRPVKEKRGV